MKEVSYQEYEKELESMGIVPRLCHIHMLARNIPRKFLEEYLELPQDRMEEIFKEEGNS